MLQKAKYLKGFGEGIFLSPPLLFQERFIMTDTMIQGIAQEKDDLEMAQAKEEFKRMRQLAPGEEVPEGLLKMYKKYEKQRSILGINGAMHPIEKLQLSTMYDFAKADYTLPKPKPIDDHIFNPQKPVAEEEDNRELVEPEKGYTYVKDEKVGAKFNGGTRLGTFLGYLGKDHDTAKVKIQGEKLNFSKIPVKDIKPYKEVE